MVRPPEIECLAIVSGASVLYLGKGNIKDCLISHWNKKIRRMLASRHINQPTTGRRSQFVQVLVRLSYYDITPRPATPYLVKTLSTATVTEGATILRLHKMAVLRLLHTDGRFAELFTTYLLYRNI